MCFLTGLNASRIAALMSQVQGQQAAPAPARQSTVSAQALVSARATMPANQNGPLATNNKVSLTKLDNPQQSGQTIKPSLLGV